MTSPLLRIGLVTQPLEHVAAKLALAGVFTDDRPLRGAAGRADWRLCGLLSDLILAKSMTGAAGEVTLVGSSGRLASEALLVVGLGARREFDAAAYERAVRTAFDRVAGLAAETVVVGSLGIEPDEWASQARGFVDGALAGLGSRSASALLCVSGAEEGRVHRELVRCGRTSAIDLAGPSSLSDPAGRIARNPLAPR